MAEASPAAFEPTPTPRKRGKWWRILKEAGCAGLLAAGAFWFFYIHDERPPDDADLMTQDAPVPDEQNGYVQLRKMNQKTLLIEELAKTHGVSESDAVDIFLGYKTDDSLVHEFLVQVQPDFAELERCLSLPYFIFPERDIRPDTRMPEIAIGIELAKDLQLNSRVQQQAGNYPGAVQAIELIRRFAIKQAEAHGAIMSVMTSYACEGFAARTAILLLNDRSLPSNERDMLAKVFAPTKAWDISIAKGMQTEYKFFHYWASAIQAKNAPLLFDNPLEYPLPTPIAHWIQFSFQTNSTRREAAELYRTASRTTGQTYANLHIPPIQSDEDFYVHRDIMNIVRPNFGGRFLLSIFCGPIYEADCSSYEQKATDGMLEVGFALRHYYDDKGSLPAKLDELVPQYLPAIPMDPFDGHLLRYDAAKGIVYSVGKSLKDLGGSSRIRLTKGALNYDDPISDPEQPTLLLEFQKAAKTAH